MLTPRPHQVPVVDASIAAFRQGVRRQVIHLATGGGKTPVAAIIAAKLDEVCRQVKGRPMRVIALAHRDELLGQMARTLRLGMPDSAVTIMQADAMVNGLANVIVASTPTAHRRIEWIRAWASGCFLNPDAPRTGRPDLFIVDEAHHYTTVAKTFVAVLDAFPETPRIGLTATPHRTDRESLASHFDKVVISRSMLDGVMEGWLCDMRGRIVRVLDMDLSQVRVRNGDFVEEDLEAQCNTDAVNRAIVDAWKKYASERLTFAFCINVKHAYDLAEAFRAAGVEAQAVDGTTPRDVRRLSVQRFREGHTRVLCNFGLFTEGTDVPEVSAILMARPTKSKLVYQQVVGRGSRVAPGKANCLVLDIVGAIAKHKQPIMLGTLYNAEDLLDRKWGDRNDITDEDRANSVSIVDKFASEEQGGLYQGEDELPSILDALGDVEATTDEFDMVRRPPPRAKLQWASFLIDGATKPVWVLEVGRYGRLLVEEHVDPDDVDLSGFRVLRQLRDGTKRPLHEEILDYGAAFGLAEDLARQCATATPPDGWVAAADVAIPDHVLLDPNAKWRSRPASPRQEAKLRKLDRWRDGMTAGEATAIISAEESRKDGQVVSVKQVRLLIAKGGHGWNGMTRKQWIVAMRECGGFAEAKGAGG